MNPRPSMFNLWQPMWCLVGLSIVLACGSSPETSSASSGVTSENADAPLPLLVLPPAIRVRRGVGSLPTFRLDVIAKDASGALVNPGTLSWSSTPPGATFTSNGSATVVKLSPALNAAASVKVVASNGSRTGSATVTIESSIIAGSDEVRAPFVAGDDPPVLLSSGAFSSGTGPASCRLDAMAAFVGSASIGNWTGAGSCDRYQAVVFSVSHRPHFANPMAWTTSVDVVDGSDAEPPVRIPLQVVIGVAPAHRAAAVAMLNTSLLLAEGILHEMRSGIRIPPSLQTTITEEVSASLRQCSDISLLPASQAPAIDRLNVYVVDQFEGIQKGYFCSPNVLVISRLYSVSTTVAHEFGHALGLVAQSGGHVESVKGMGKANVMHGYTGSGYDERTRFTIGQVFRMHFDGRSWVMRGSDMSAGPNRCPCDPYLATACPQLPTDLGVGAVAPVPLPAKMCP